RLAWKEEHQRGRSKYGDAGQRQPGMQATRSLTDQPDEIGTEKSAEIGDGADQSDAGGGGESGEEFAGQGVERAVDAVNTQSGDAEERHGRKDGVSDVHRDEGGSSNERGNCRVGFSLLSAV